MKAENLKHIPQPAGFPAGFLGYFPLAQLVGASSKQLDCLLLFSSHFYWFLFLSSHQSFLRSICLPHLCIFKFLGLRLFLAPRCQGAAVLIAYTLLGEAMGLVNGSIRDENRRPATVPELSKAQLTF